MSGFILSAEEAAALKICGVSTIIKAAKRGELPHSRKGMPNGSSKRLFRAEDLAAWTPPRMPHEPAPRMDPKAFTDLWLAGVPAHTIETKHAHTSRHHVRAYAEELGILNDPRRADAIARKMDERNKRCGEIARSWVQARGEEEAAEAWALWRQGQTIDAISKALGRRPCTVSRLMQRYPSKQERADA